MTCKEIIKKMRIKRVIVQCKSVCPICGQSAYVGKAYIRYCKRDKVYVDGLDMPVKPEKKQDANNIQEGK